MSRLAVTVISGFAHTGKTGVLLDLLRQEDENERIAVIMNDIAEVVSGVPEVRTAMGSAQRQLLELPNGCICCTQKDVFLQAVEKIVESSVEHLYIEGNATAEPYLIQGFLKESAFADHIDIQNMITVIDASTFLQDYLSTDDLRQRGLVALPHDDRVLSEVLTEQIECADTLVLTKCDLVSDADVVFLETVLTALNPKAEITVLGKKERAQSNQKVNSFTFAAQKPFHPQRLYAALSTSAFNSVLRARGTAWIATRQQYKVLWSQTGSICSLEADGPWWNSESSIKEKKLNAQPLKEHGNRHQEIEFIGTDNSVMQLRKILEECLLTEVEMELGPDLWAHFDDPFEQWDDQMDRSLFVVREANNEQYKVQSHQ